jgi:hypothetical protein
MKDAKPAKTPMGTDGHADLNKGGKSVDQKAYRSMIGSLLYLCASRLDIMLDINPAPRNVTLWPLSFYALLRDLVSKGVYLRFDWILRLRLCQVQS